MKKLSGFVLVAMLVLGTTNCAKLQARDNLNKGVRAFRGQKYDDAIQRFKTAIELDPTLNVAQLYLATAYAQQYIPNDTSEENEKFAKKAIETYETVLNLPGEENNINAIAGLASMYQHTKELPKAREFYLRETVLEPENKTPFYAIGSVNWIIVYGAARKEDEAKALKAAAKGQPKSKEPLPEEPPIMPREEQAKLVDEGLVSLDKALALDPDYEDAMIYQNLLLRQKARLSEDKADQEKYIAQADVWFQKVLETRKKNQEKKKGPGGIVLDTPAEPAKP